MMSTTCGRILSSTRCTTASTSAGSGTGGADGLGDVPEMRDPTELSVGGPGATTGFERAPMSLATVALGGSGKLNGEGGGMVRAGDEARATGTGIETACNITASLALTSRLAVISAHLCMGTD